MYDCRELAIVHEALDRIQSYRDTRSGRAEVCSVSRRSDVPVEYQKETTKVVYETEVPPVPIAQAIEEAHAETAPPAEPEVRHVGTTVSVVAEVQPPTEKEAIAVYREATNKGVLMQDIIELLSQNKVKRVSELAPEQRAGFIAALKGKIERATS